MQASLSTQVRVPPSGPIPAEILILGEAPGRDEELSREPFVGSSGKLLTAMLHEIGIARTTCFIANVCEYRPPDNEIGEWMSDNVKSPDPTWIKIRNRWVHPLIAEGYKRLWEIYLPQINPKIILAVGGTALWALTGNTGIAKWRGSRLSVADVPCPIVPCFHPAAVLRQMELLPALKMDMRRLKAIYEGRQVPRLYDFNPEPSFGEVEDFLHRVYRLADLNEGKLSVSADIETKRGHIACFGLTVSENSALCIPLIRNTVGLPGEGEAASIRPSPFYWSESQEALILFLLWRLFRHDNIEWVGQNFLYDCQYFYRHWHVLPKHVYDTMIGHHATFSTMRKGLDFLSSMYAQDHIYWKDESKNWDPAIGELQLWTYNCKDAAITYEIAPRIKANASPVQEHHDFQQSLFFPVLRMMNRGIRIDQEKRKKLRNDLFSIAETKQAELDRLVGHPVNPRSSKQLIKLFYTDFGLPGIRTMQSEGLTANSDALQQIVTREPILLPVCQRIAELRSIGVFISTFIDAKLDADSRMRCSFAIAGTHSYRFTSSENAFGSGANLQNIPIEEKQKIKQAKDYVKLPNIRELFIPDLGKEFFDLDLDRADLQVVVWEAEDKELKLALRMGIDMHCLSACQIFDVKGVPFEELAESHPNYPEHRGRIGYAYRQKAKVGVHATNYGVGDYKLASSLGISTRDAGAFKARWFGAHPGIRKWQLRVAQDELRGFTENRFGARLYHLGRFDLPEALAWVPQSTVSGVINRALRNIDAAKESGACEVELLIQVHDSLAGQYPFAKRVENLEALRTLSQIVIPYPDPLIIPIGIKTSTVSWGACK